MSAREQGRDARGEGAGTAPYAYPAVDREPPLHLLAARNLKCTTLCPVLDAFLRGGVPTRHLTELAGEAGAAKTQLCLQLLLAAQLPRAVGGLDGAAVYIHTEGRAPLLRLKQLIASHPNVAPRLPPDHDPLDHVYLVKTLDDPDGLWNALASTAALLRDPPGGARRPVRLIVVDSISSPFRETDATQRGGLADRTGMLSRVSALLKEYAHRHDVAVVLTNHVSDAVTDDGGGDARFTGGGGAGGAGGYGYSGGNSFFNVKQRRLFGPAGDLRSSGRAVVPSLGLFWANCVNTRVFLSRSGGSAGGYDGGGGGGGGGGAGGMMAAGEGGVIGHGLVGGVRRKAQIVFSSHLPSGNRNEREVVSSASWNLGGGEVGNTACDFDVRENGVWGRSVVDVQEGLS